MLRKGQTQSGEHGTDRELVERAKAGDQDAFNLLVLKYQNRIVNLVSRYVSDHAEALDVAQEAFIKAYRGLARFRGESAFYTWLYRIAINTAKNHLVAQGRRPPSEDIDMQTAEQFSSQAYLREYDTPEHMALRDEIEETVMSAIEALPDDLRTAIMLRELEGMSYEEIAQAMDCPVGTVRSRIFRAREAVNARLDPLLSD